MVNRATVKTVPEMFRDLRRVRDWIDPNGRYLVTPADAGRVRLLLVAESGTGKTFLINALIMCMLQQGWPVVFIDAKGDPADAASLRRLAESYGHTVASGESWNFWTGSAEDITTKLMRLLPAPDGANQYYLDEVRGVLQAIQSHSPLTSIHDLRHRIDSPAPYVRDSHDLALVTQEVTRDGQTAGQRVLHTIAVALRPLEQFIDDDGWSYGDRHAQLTIVPISPVDDAQATIGDLLLVDLRAYIARRLKDGDKTPAVLVIDEFPQLVTDGADPGDVLARLAETMRSAGVGIIAATQSVAGVSNDEVNRRRVMASGIGLMIGRSKDPEDVVQFAGTTMQQEASGQATGDSLNSARAQHTYLIPVQDVREAADGNFWLVQGGAIAPFRSFPLRARTQPPAPISPAPEENEPTTE